MRQDHLATMPHKAPSVSMPNTPMATENGGPRFAASSAYATKYQMREAIYTTPSRPAHMPLTNIANSHSAGRNITAFSIVF